MFRSIASFFSRAVGIETSEPAEGKSSEKNKQSIPQENKVEETVIITKKKASEVKSSRMLPELNPIDKVMEYITPRTAKITLPKDPTESFILRPIIPSDRTKMYNSLSRSEISTKSLFMRFTNAKKTFTERELDYFSRLNYADHNGVGIVLDKPGYPGVATCRYFIEKNDPTTAEWAVTVIDKYQGQGIGVLLFYSICVLAHLNGIKHLKAVINPENHSVLNWMQICHSRDVYEDQSLFHVIDLPIAEDFYKNPEIAAEIVVALKGEGKMDDTTAFATKLELKQFYDELEDKDSDTEDFTGITCSSYDDDARSRVFSSNNHLLCEMMDEISVSSRSNSIDDIDFDF